MFDIGFWELGLIALVALLVVGPQRLPKLAYEAGLWVGKLQRVISSAKIEIENELHNYEIRNGLREQRRDFDDLKKIVTDTQRDIEAGLLDPDSNVSKQADVDKDERGS